MKNTAPLSQSQQGLYVECMDHVGEFIYYIPFLYTLSLRLDATRLCRAVEQALEGHPVLRTRISLDADGAPVQWIDSTAEPWTVTVEDVADIREAAKGLMRPFNLLEERLCRVHLLRDASHLGLFIECHHIICDGTSLQILLSDIETLYEGGSVEAERLTLSQYAAEESALRQTDAFEEARQWYAQNFDGADTFSRLMPDCEDETSAISTQPYLLHTDLRRVEAFCRDNGIFKSTFFTAAFAYLLARYGHEEEALFSTVFNGRTDERLIRSVGMFVKTIPVFARFSATDTVTSFLSACQNQMTGCRNHSLYGFGDAVSDLHLSTDANFGWHGNIFGRETFGGEAYAEEMLLPDRLATSLYLKAYVRAGQICTEAIYHASEYTPALIQAFLQSYEAVVEGFLTKDLLRDVSLLSDEQERLLDSFNETSVPLDASQTVLSLFKEQVRLRPESTAVVYKDRAYTYAEVDALSDRLAAYILSKGLGREQVVSILVPRCEWMAIAPLSVLKAGCAYQPLDPTYPQERLRFMMEDASAQLLLYVPPFDSSDTEAAQTFAWVSECGVPVFELASAALLPAPAEPFDSWRSVRPEDLFVLLYTSGSTGTPKGVMIEHRQIVAFSQMYRNTLHLLPSSRVGAYASFGFDASLMEIWATLMGGASLYVIPEELRLDLVALNDYFERCHITHTFMTTQVGRQFVNEIHNTSLQGFVTGGEKLSDVVAPPYLLINGYGPTESICFITAYPVTRQQKRIPIGRAVENMHLFVIDANGHRQPIGAAGELWVHGPQVSRGYLNRPEKTAEAYVSSPWGRCYRTGDIVRYLPDGNIEFVGRRDGQVKIRGFRIELKEIETVIRAYPGIRDVTVQAFDEDGGGKFVAAYVVADNAVDVTDLNNFILQQKPPYMVPAVTMQIDAIPLNQNQKVNKKALPRPEKPSTNGREGAAAPMNVLEEELHAMVAAIVGSTDFDITTILGYAGLTSISAIRLAVQVNKRFGVALDAKSLVKTGTLQTIENEILAQYMHAAEAPTSAQEAPAAAPDAEPEDFPLSYAQTGVYFDSMKNPADIIYNIPVAIKFPVQTDASQLARAVAEVAQQHAELFVHFSTDGTDVIQRVDRESLQQTDSLVPCVEMTDAALEVHKHDFVRPFNLRSDLLFRLEIVRTETSLYLLADFHHLVFDGASLDLFVSQLCERLDGADLQAESLTYAQYVSAEKAAEHGERHQADRDFFAQTMEGFENATEIPTDLTSSQAHGQEAEQIYPIDFARIEQFCHDRSLTPAHLMLAALYYTVGRYAHTRDVFLSTVSSGRSDVRISDTIGMFVNTLALHGQIADVSVSEFLQSVSADFDATLRHEQYPYARIAADYGFRSQINYVYQVGVTRRYSVGGEPLSIETLSLKTPKFKVCVLIEQREEKYYIVVQYDDAFYSADAMAALAESIGAVTNHFMDAPDARLRSVSIMSPRQRSEMLPMHESGRAAIPTLLLHQGMEQAAQTTPERLALVASDGRFTYAEFNRMASQIAASLWEQGVRPRDRVAMLLPRTSRVMLTMYGILKTGAAFIPCDPHYPADRIQLILDDSEARFIVTDKAHLALVPSEKALDVELLLAAQEAVDSADGLAEKSDPHAARFLRAETSEVGTSPEDLAYLIYTSGSTGRPKGVMLHHRGICNELTAHPLNRRNDIARREGHAVLGLTSLSFDGSFVEHGLSLFNGLTFVLVHDDYVNDPLATAQLMDDCEVDIICSAQSRLVSFMESDRFMVALRRCLIIMCGGEKFPDGLMRRLQRDVPSAHIFNCYGPTETTVESNSHELTHASVVTVGRPLLNTIEIVVDQDLNELPVGVVGELLIGGVQVAYGYNNLPEKTSAAFITWPPSASSSLAQTDAVGLQSQRFYRTGDFARWDADGNVHILGRTDNQIKLRGQRIELGEIESNIMRVEGITNVCVLIRRLKGADHLCAYYVANREIPAEQVKAEISRSLTTYMVPTAYLQLPEMPVTPNGKVNTKALPEPQMLSASEYVAPVNEVERTFCDIFASVLEVERVGATDNFFELGGTSLMVTRVIIEADKQGFHVVYGDVFSHNTPRLLARLVSPDASTSDAQADSTDADVEGFDYSAIASLLQAQTLDAFRHGKPLSLGSILLTGATGFLGIHVLHELIAQTEQVERITCLVRGTSVQDAERRLKGMLFYYFEHSYEEQFASGRIGVVVGDVTQDFSSLPSLPQIDVVFNCAANVKHFSTGTDIEDVNVGGAKHCVEFCSQTGARLVHVSTSSICGLSIDGHPSPDATLTEQQFYLGQELSNQYIHSKFLAERIILNAVARQDLQAKIMRVGNLSARSTDGEFQANFSSNTFMGRIKVYNMLGCCPHDVRNMHVEFSPINETARAIVLLSTTPTDCIVFHPYNIHGQFLGDVLEGLSAVGSGVRFVEQEEFDAALQRAKENPQQAQVMSSMLAYQNMGHGRRAAFVRTDNNYTTQVLYRLGFSWSPTSADYVERMLQAIGAFGFFDA